MVLNNLCCAIYHDHVAHKADGDRQQAAEQHRAHPEQHRAHPSQASESASGVVWILIGVVVLAAIGLFVYKKHNDRKKAARFSF